MKMSIILGKHKFDQIEYEDLGAAVGVLTRSPDSVSFGTNWLDWLDGWPNWPDGWPPNWWRLAFSAGAGVCRGATPWKPPTYKYEKLMMIFMIVIL